MTIDTNGTRALDTLELGVLEACLEVTVRQRELIPLLARTLAIPDGEVFYTWTARRCPQSGEVEGTDWQFFFHGLECDLKNSADGRFLRVDFGPGGSLDTFTAWGVLQLIMTSTHPWPEFSDLRRQFAEKGPPFDQYSGSLAKLGPVWDHLTARGVFEEADPGLVKLAAEHTSVGPDGLRRIQFPLNTSEKTRVDCSVAHRLRLSACGRQVLDARLTASGRR